MECYSLVVGQGGINPEYFWYRMQWWEVQAFIEGMQQRERETLEMMRLQTCFVLNGMGVKKGGDSEPDPNALTPLDIVRFPWDKDDDELAAERAEAAAEEESHLEDLRAQCEAQNLRRKGTTE